MFMPPCYDPVTRKDCEKRVLGCHDTCEKWKAYEKLRNAEYDKRKQCLEVNCITRQQKDKAYAEFVKRRKH